MPAPNPVTVLGIACYFVAAVAIAVRFFKWR